MQRRGGEGRGAQVQNVQTRLAREYFRRDQTVEELRCFMESLAPRTERSSLSLDKRVSKGPHSWPLTHSTSVWERDVVREGPLHITHVHTLFELCPNQLCSCDLSPQITRDRLLISAEI